MNGAPEDERMRAFSDRLLSLVPEDGAAIGNGELRKRLRLDEEGYLAVRDPLIDAGLIHRWKGRGGTVRRILRPQIPIEGKASAEEVAEQATEDRLAEAALYEPMARVIATTRAKRLGEDLLGFAITARAGKKATGGFWTRPDIVTIEVKSPKFVFGKYLNVNTFEIKPSDSVDIRAIYESLAHLRSATHAWVIFHVPSDWRTSLDPVIAEVQQEAAAHGIGLIVAADPSNYDTWEELETAQRREPDPQRLDTFIEVQLDKHLQDKILKWK